MKQTIVQTLEEWSCQDNQSTRFPYYYTISDIKSNGEDWYDDGVFFTKSDAKQYLEQCSKYHTKNAKLVTRRFTLYSNDTQTIDFINALFDYFGITKREKDD